MKSGDKAAMAIFAISLLVALYCLDRSWNIDSDDVLKDLRDFRSETSINRMP